MSRDWIGFSLNAVDSGLQLYWSVRKRLCDNEENTQKCAQQSLNQNRSWNNCDASSFNTSQISPNSPSSSPTSKSSWTISNNSKRKDCSSPPRRGSNPRQLQTIKEEIECFNSN